MSAHGNNDTRVEKSSETNDEEEPGNNFIDIEIEGEVKKNMNEMSINVYDLGRWNNIDNNFRDILIEKGHIRESEISLHRSNFSCSYSKPSILYCPVKS